MQVRQFEITNKKGLHARAAAKLINVASHFEADILIQKGDNEVNGKSILGLLMLAAQQGCWVTVRCDGEDEQEAMAEIEKLIQSKFQESE